MIAVATRSRLRGHDLLRVGSVGLRTRRLRAGLSGLGIAIGIAAMVSVLGISESSRANLLAQLDRLGTNLLTVTPGQTFGGGSAELPSEATGMISRIGPVRHVTATGSVQGTVRRTDRIDANETGGISILAAQPDLVSTLGATVAHGTFLNAATARYPAVVLGWRTAQTLGIDHVDTTTRVWLANRWFSVVGVLNPVPLAPEVDRTALVGFPVAQDRLGFDGKPGTIYERSDPKAVDAVRQVLAVTANPAHPEQVSVSRPSDALAARAATNTTFTALLLGLGAVALLVGGVGIANVMVISVLERRSEIGLRRALGATRGHVRLQFLAESLLLSGLGGVAGASLGAAITAGYAHNRGWLVSIPPAALAGGVGIAIAIGAVAGLYPAVRAARLSPTDALRTV
jgi:putative ABC transport system permease protein